MHSKQFAFRLALTLAACGAGWAFAQDAPQPTAGFGVPVSAGQLEDLRGGFDVVKNDAQLAGTVANNTADHVLSGSNSIAEGSFANSNGLPMVIQNSGSNVLIQNSTIVNVQLQ